MNIDNYYSPSIKPNELYLDIGDPFVHVWPIRGYY